MIKALVSDFSRVLLFPKDKSYVGSLNGLHKELSVDLDYKLLDHFEVNTELLKYYESLKEKVDLYILTSETIQDSPELLPYLSPIFKKIYSASKMGTSKKEASCYEAVAGDLNMLPGEILYVDDSMDNIEPARTTGLEAILYEDNNNVISKIKERLQQI